MALTSTTSAKSQHDKQIKQTLTWGFGSLKLLHENTVFFIFLFQNLFPTNVQDILRHFYNIFAILVIITNVF